MLATAVVMQVVMLTPGFHPPLDAPIRIVMERVETLPAERRYRLETAARFAREGEGYRAELRVVGNGADSPGPLASMVEHGFAAMAGRTIVMHLDRQGHLIAIDDLARLWERFCQAVAENAAARPNLAPEAAAALAARVAAPLRAFPEAKQRDALGGLLTVAFAIDPMEPVGSSRAVQLPGASPFGGALTLQGTRGTRAVEGGIEAVTQAEADVALPGEGATPARHAHVAVDRRRRFDPATGMVSLASDSTQTVTGAGAEQRTTTLVTTTRVSRNATWPN